MTRIQRFFREEVSAKALFIAGLVLFPAFLFQPFLSIRCVLALLFLALNAATGKRINPVLTSVMTLSIVAFNLVVPFGRVLATLGGFKITKGALLGGIEKAVTVEGLIWLSQLVVRPDIRIPGVAGKLLAGSFGYFARITEEKKSIERQDIFGSLDRMLNRLWEAGPSPQQDTPRSRASMRGVIALVFLGIICVAPFALRFMHALPGWVTWD